MFETLLTSPTIAIVLLTCLLAEAVILLMLWKRKLIGLPPLQTLSFLGAGACFALALGFALGGADAAWLGMALVGAFIFHALDIYLRWTH